MNWLAVDNIIKNALLEDIPNEDISTNCIVDENSMSTVELQIGRASCRERV